MQEQTDFDLITKAAAGDMKAFRVLVEKHQSMAYSIAYRFLNNQHDSQDVLQEAFVRVWKNLVNYRPQVKFTTWLYKIVSNLCLDVLKSKHHKQSMLNVPADAALKIDSPNNPLSELEINELQDNIHLAAESLTSKQRAVFILRDIQGMSSAEVEDILSMSSGTVKSNLYYARINMTELLKGYYKEYKSDES